MTQPAATTDLRMLGNSDLRLTPIGFGAWAIGGGNWEYAWGPQDDDESIWVIPRRLWERLCVPPVRSRWYLRNARCAGILTAPFTDRSSRIRWRRKWRT